MIYEIGPDSAWQTHSLTLSVPKKPRRSPKYCGLLPNTPFRLRKIENHPYSKGRRNPAGKAIEFLKVDFRQCDWPREGQGVHRLHSAQAQFRCYSQGCRSSHSATLRSLSNAAIRQSIGRRDSGNLGSTWLFYRTLTYSIGKDGQFHERKPAL